MKFSEQWLREWVNPAVSTTELAEQLTMAGLEVDAIEPVAGEFVHVVVGEVIKLERHPDADKLRVCQVDVGESTPLQIVCGASNVTEGMKVPAALVGAKLPGGLKIKKSRLRGVESHGMLCSAKELGLADHADGLLPLAADAPVGQSVRDYLQLDDVMIELGLTPNRGDCLSIAGVARETGVLNNLDVTMPEMPAIAAAHNEQFPVRLDSASLACPHYCGRLIKGIRKSVETPLWLQERLRRSGIRSLSPVVDVTNYVLLELGQPMHAFDFHQLSDYLEVRYARKGETLTLLDEQEIMLGEKDLIIADAHQPLALAGIMGGLASSVQDDTVDIFLESACFDPLSIAGRARSHGLHTDSSHRFERGVSPELQRLAMERATALLVDIVGGSPGPVIEAGDRQSDTPAIVLREARIERILGAKLDNRTVETILTRLDMQFERSSDGWRVTPPAFRFDISLEVDLIEELARIYGYNNLPLQRPAAELAIQPMPESHRSLRLIRQQLADIGYQETVTYSFVDEAIQSVIEPEQTAMRLANPISSEMAVMRTSLWPGLIQAAQFNLHRQQNRLFLFECGLKFTLQANDLNQEMFVAGLALGDRYLPNWSENPTKVDFFDIKGHVTALFDLSVCSESVKFKAETHPALHPGQSARLYCDEKPVGWLGLIHPGVAKQLNLDHTMYLFEIKADSLQEGMLPKYQAVSKFPAIRRDISVVVDRSVTSAEVQSVVRKAAPETLKKIELFDMYMGEGIDSGRKSLSLGLILQDISRTLTDIEIEEVMQRVIEQLRLDLGATLRQ